MSGKGKTHQRVLAILTYLNEYTEKGKPINIYELKEYLGELSATRQIIYNDLHEFEKAGIGISHDKNKHYYYDKKSLSDGELSLLADVICSSSYLDANSAENLILQIKQMTNMKKFDILTQHTDIFLRNKTLNSECIQNIDLLHEAIFEKKQIQFSYAKYNKKGILWYDILENNKYIKFEMIAHKNFKKEWTIAETYFIQNKKDVNVKSLHTISPYKLMWDNSQCYLIGGYTHKNKFKLRVYRADKIFNLKILSFPREEISVSSPFFHQSTSFNAEKFIRTIFEMYGSTDNCVTGVTFLISKNLSGVVLDKFGDETKLIEYNDNYFTFKVDIQVSDKFFGWITGFNPDQLKILHPKSLSNEYKMYLKSIIDKY